MTPLTLCFLTVPEIHRASYRFRVGYVAEGLTDMGDEVTTLDLNGFDPAFSKPYLSDRFDAVIATKPAIDDRQLLIAQDAKARGTFIVFDVCDDHFSDHNDLAAMSLYLRTARLADLVICSTPVLAERIKAATQQQAVVIPEPLEFEEPVKPRASMPRRLLWHGHASNLDGLLEIMPQIRDYRLHVITNGVDNEEDARSLGKFLGHTDGIYENWSIEAVREGHAACDLVIVPIQNGHKSYKGHQRGVEAMMLGRMSIVSAIPAYDYWPVWRAQTNAAFGFLIDGYAETVKQRPQEILSQIKRGQQQAQQQLSRARIAELWHNAIATALERRRAA